MNASRTEVQGHVSVFSPRFPGVPGGYSGLPRELVLASQRQRLLHGVTSVVAEKGYGPATIADITSQAGVSKKTFYDHFPDKLACFIAAYSHGRKALEKAVTDTTRAAADAGLDAIDQLRQANHSYLAFLAAEAPYARMFFLEILVVGQEGVAQYQRCRAAFETLLRTWHDRARKDHPHWPRASDTAFEAAVGLAHDLALTRIATGRAAELLDIEDELLDIELSILGVPRQG